MIRQQPSLILLFSLLVVYTHAFTFMKGWKLPTRNKGAKEAMEKFGDKSKLY